MINKKLFIIIPILFIIFIGILLLKNFRNVNYSNEYYSSGIVLKGVITDKIFFQKDQGLLKINILDCNTNQFDLRSQNKDYNLIVKNKKAEFVSYYFPDINISDTILIDFNNRYFQTINLNNDTMKLELPETILSKWYKDELKKHLSL